MDNKGLIWKLKKFQTLIDRLNTQFGGTQESFDCKFQTLIDRLNTNTVSNNNNVILMIFQTLIDRLNTCTNCIRPMHIFIFQTLIDRLNT